MVKGISEALTFAIGVAISCVPIIAVILMLFSERTRVAATNRWSRARPACGHGPDRAIAAGARRPGPRTRATDDRGSRSGAPAGYRRQC